MWISVGKDGSIIEKLKELLEDYIKKTKPEYYPPVENLLDLIYEHYTENNPVEKNTVAGKAAKAKEKELEEWLRGLEGMDRLVDDYVGDKIPLWEKIDYSGALWATCPDFGSHYSGEWEPHIPVIQSHI